MYVLEIGRHEGQSKSTWQAKIQFSCIDRYLGKIKDKLF